MIYSIFFVFSLVLTYGTKVFAYKKSIIDIPNERSSHATPTPRGGGVAIVVVFFIGIFYFKESLDTKLSYALLCAIPIAIIGLIDDVITLSSKIRFLVQGISTLGALYFLGGVNSIDFLFFKLDGEWLNLIAFIAIIWLSNLYNFLDGIDGYAASEAAVVGVGIHLFFVNPLGLVVTVASMGFLVFNWHKASIFMGDVGSVTLGFIFAIFIFYDTSEGNIYIWLVLLSLFWFDATVTLIRRLLNAEKITQAHRKHAYQRLVQSGWKHDKVVLFSFLFNGLFLVLLYFIQNNILVFLFNILFLVIIIWVIENKKSFYDDF